MPIFVIIFVIGSTLESKIDISSRPVICLSISILENYYDLQVYLGRKCILDLLEHTRWKICAEESARDKCVSFSLSSLITRHYLGLIFGPVRINQ